MKRTPRALLLLAAWVIALAILGWFVQRQLVVGADLRLFLPSPTTPEQRLLLEEVGEGPASRVLAIALDGAPPEQLADISRELVAALQDSREFRLVTNGEFTLDSVPDELLPYRFLLSPTVDTQRFDAQYLHAELLARARDLASPAGSFLEPWLPRDPTLEMLKLLQRWQPMQEPRREYDVWFDRSGRRALLIAESQAPAFDPDRQRAALQELERALTAAASGASVKMTRERRRKIFGADGAAHARTSAGPRHGGDCRHDPVAADRVSPHRQHRAQCAAARQRGACRLGRGERAVRHRARHHACFRVHAHRRRAGLSAAPAESSAPGPGAGGNRTTSLADARDRSSEHLHRVLHILVLGRHRPRAAGLLHRGWTCGRRIDDALRAATADGPHGAGFRRLALSRSLVEPDRGAAAHALDCSGHRRRRSRGGRTVAPTVLGERPRAPDAGSRRPACCGISNCARSLALRTCATCSSSMRRTAIPR